MPRHTVGKLKKLPKTKILKYKKGKTAYNGMTVKRTTGSQQQQQKSET